MAATVRIEFLGDPQISRDGQPLAVQLPRKVTALLAYLILTERPQARDRLAAIFWADAADEAARASLRKALATLRRELGDLLVATRTSVAIDPEASVWCDVTAFEAALRQGEDAADLATATALYGGDFLANLTVPDADPFESWALAQRARLRGLALAAFSRLASRQLAVGDFDGAGALLRRLLELDPWNEAAHRQFLHALAAGGDRAAALAEHTRFRVALADGLGVEPSAETNAVVAQLRAGVLPPVPPLADVAPVAPAPVSSGAHNLPAPLTSFIGREDDLARVLALSEGAERLLTIVGTGGMGKTRLALAAAWALRPRFGDGVWWIPLAGLPTGEAPASERTMVAGMVATALGLVLAGRDAPIDRLAALLRERNTLLVLDNAEHLPELALVARTLLEAAPGLRILVTSRAPLGVMGETLLRLEGLAVRSASAADILAAPAVRLFLARGAQHAPGWDGAAAASGVLRLVRLLEGMPLGIELAAGWVGHYTPDEIADTIAADPDFLAARARDVPERHRSLRAVFDYTWELLTADERNALARLTVFQGTFDREAAQAVSGAGALTLVALTDKSLLRQAGPGRYFLHELLRQFAAARLAATGELATLHARHATHYLALAERAAPHLTGPEQAVWCDRLDSDLDNLRAALGWARQAGAAEFELRLAGALGRFWSNRGYLAEGRDWLEAALALPAAAMTTALIRARALYAAGVLANAQGDQSQAVRWLELALTLYQETDEPLGAVRVLTTLGGVAFDSGDLPTAIARYGECLPLARAVGDAGEVARALANQGEAIYHQGDLAGAGERYEAALVLARQAGRRDVEAYVLGDLANVARRRGDLAESAALHRQALQLKVSVGQRRQIAITLEDLATLAVAEGHGERAARLLGAATALRAAIGAPMAVPEQQALDREIGAMRVTLGAAAWATAFAAGSALPLDAVVAAALAPADSVSTGSAEANAV